MPRKNPIVFVATNTKADKPTLTRYSGLFIDAFRNLPRVTTLNPDKVLWIDGDTILKRIPSRIAQENHTDANNWPFRPFPAYRNDDVDDRLALYDIQLPVDDNAADVRGNHLRTLYSSPVKDLGDFVIKAMTCMAYGRNASDLLIVPFLETVAAEGKNGWYRQAAVNVSCLLDNEVSLQGINIYGKVAPGTVCIHRDALPAVIARLTHILTELNYERAQAAEDPSAL